MSDDKYTPNMEKLKSELGRTPPTMVVQGSKPEDYAPKPKPQPYVSPHWEKEVAQRIKGLMRDSDHWERLTWGEREALDMIASYMAGVCVGRDYWDEIENLAGHGRTANRDQETGT